MAITDDNDVTEEKTSRGERRATTYQHKFLVTPTIPPRFGETFWCMSKWSLKISHITNPYVECLVRRRATWSLPLSQKHFDTIDGGTLLIVVNGEKPERFTLLVSTEAGMTLMHWNMLLRLKIEENLAAWNFLSQMRDEIQVQQHLSWCPVVYRREN